MSPALAVLSTAVLILDPRGQALRPCAIVKKDGPRAEARPQSGAIERFYGRPDLASQAVSIDFGTIDNERIEASIGVRRIPCVAIDPMGDLAVA